MKCPLTILGETGQFINFAKENTKDILLNKMQIAKENAKEKFAKENTKEMFAKENTKDSSYTIPSPEEGTHLLFFTFFRTFSFVLSLAKFPLYFL